MLENLSGSEGQKVKSEPASGEICQHPANRMNEVQLKVQKNTMQHPL
jgi:hypothetical protein